MRRVFFFTRPLGVALAIFIFLNLALALQSPRLAATRIWLNLHLEPEQTLLSALLGLALLLPHGWSKVPWLRWLLGGIIVGFWMLAGASVIGYYHQLHSGIFDTDLPVPFAVLVLGILTVEFGRVSWWTPFESRMPSPARYFLGGVMLVAAFVFLILAHIITFGRTDHRRTADAAVILGAKVYDDGQLCVALKDRVDTGIELYHEGLVSYLIMSGAVGENGISEPRAMAAYAQGRGVPLSQIILDENGINTLASARNCGKIAREYGFSGLLAVSQYFHCARVKMVFERAGTYCYTVPTCSSSWRGRKETRLSREDFFLFREAVAFPFYFLYHR